MAQSGGCSVWQFRNETDDGTMTVYEVFPGVMLTFNDFHMERFESSYVADRRLFAIDHCREGRMEYSPGDNMLAYTEAGDMKLDLNAELRTYLFWKFNGAFFIDAGNIWTLRSYAEQPGGQFRFNEFYKQIAVAYGLGLRLNLDYFVLRFDAGMKAVNPAYETSREHYPIMHPSFSRDFSFHFAVGLPF